MFDMATIPKIPKRFVNGHRAGTQSESAAAIGLIRKPASSRVVIRLGASISKPESETSRAVRVRVIQAGLGNLSDMYYFDRAALASLVPLLEGAKIYADHGPRESTDARSVRDIIGYYGEVAVGEADGVAEITATAHVLDGDATTWAWDLLRSAAERSGPDLVGISISANGESEPAKIDVVLAEISDSPAKEKILAAKSQGKTIVNRVRKFLGPVSADLVSEAGAGGRIMSVMEGEMKETDETSGETIALPPMGEGEALSPEEVRAALMALMAIATKLSDAESDEAKKDEYARYTERYRMMAEKMAEAKGDAPVEEGRKDTEIEQIKARLHEMEHRVEVEKILSEFSVPAALRARIVESLRTFSTETEMRGEMAGWLRDIGAMSAAGAPLMREKKMMQESGADNTALFRACMG